MVDLSNPDDITDDLEKRLAYWAGGSIPVIPQSEKKKLDHVKAKGIIDRLKFKKEYYSGRLSVGRNLKIHFEGSLYEQPDKLKELLSECKYAEREVIIGGVNSKRMSIRYLCLPASKGYDFGYYHFLIAKGDYVFQTLVKGD